MYLELWYQRIWGTLNVVLGILFSVIFLLGAAVLNDPMALLYLLFTGPTIYMGRVRLRKPYVVCREKAAGADDAGGEIIVYHSFGQIAEHYHYQSRDEISVKGDRLYQNGKKLKFSKWFTNQHQWAKIKRYYLDGTLPSDDLQDL